MGPRHPTRSRTIRRRAMGRGTSAAFSSSGERGGESGERQPVPGGRRPGEEVCDGSWCHVPAAGRPGSASEGARGCARAAPTRRGRLPRTRSAPAMSSASRAGVAIWRAGARAPRSAPPPSRGEVSRESGRGLRPRAPDEAQESAHARRRCHRDHIRRRPAWSTSGRPRRTAGGRGQGAPARPPQRPSGRRWFNTSLATPPPRGSEPLHGSSRCPKVAQCQRGAERSAPGSSCPPPWGSGKGGGGSPAVRPCAATPSGGAPGGVQGDTAPG